MRYYGVGATISNTEGLGIEGYWGHRNLFGRAEKLRIEGSVGRIGDTTDYGKLNYNAAIMFEKPGVIGPDSKFFSNLKAVSEHPDAYDRFSVKGGVGLAYQFTKTQSASVELSVDYSDIDDFFHPDGAAPSSGQHSAPVRVRQSRRQARTRQRAFAPWPSPSRPMTRLPGRHS